jgi:outer membrane protein OmpA-like peptidoglycan-associated protein
MNRKLTILFLLTFAFQQFSAGQQETYTVKKAPFCSDKYDEFSPVFYKGGIVFSSNRGSGSFVDYSSSVGKATFDINFVDTTNKVTWEKVRLFSKSLKTPLNEGPVTFNSKGDTIYFTRNLQVDGKLANLSNPRNKLGIFSAIFDGEKWTKIREIRFNNEWYNVTTPWLSPDGKRIYFASDKPDGFGGSDLYYSDWKSGYWSDPVNMGPVINTKGNEAYPFVNPAGELFFASDGHKGLGGKDIFFSRLKDNEWLTPVRLDPPVNSQYDDFGIITDSLISEGYFSSNRNNSIDIYQFRTNIPQIFYTDIQKENQYCFRFSDSGAIEVDTLNLRYIWSFGDGKNGSGAVVSHCYPGPGKYKVKLDLIDRSTGNLFFTKLSYTLELRDFEQPYINSPYAVVAGEPVNFDGLKSYLPGYEIVSYTWDFSNGNRMMGASVKYTFKQSGEFNVNLGLKLRSLSTGIIHNTGVTKKIIIYSTPQERASFITKRTSVKDVLPDIRKYENALIKNGYSAEEEFQKDAEFRIELLSSKKRIGLSSAVFRNLPGKYALKEIFNSETGLYSYVADQQMTIMATYPAYKEIIGAGFKETRIRAYTLADPAEKGIHNLKKIFGISTDAYFDNYNRLTSSAYLALDQMVRILNKYPEIILEIEVHTDNTGTPQNNLTLSQGRAKTLIDYLVNKGIGANRLIAIGKGGERPVASNYTETGKKLNRRVDFVVLKE